MGERRWRPACTRRMVSEEGRDEGGSVRSDFIVAMDVEGGMRRVVTGKRVFC